MRKIGVLVYMTSGIIFKRPTDWHCFFTFNGNKWEMFWIYIRLKMDIDVLDTGNSVLQLGQGYSTTLEPKK